MKIFFVLGKLCIDEGPPLPYLAYQVIYDNLTIIAQFSEQKGPPF